ncbi:MAG: glycosyltransferase, partial [Flavobacteriaceae bacterium]|nr:glycosyltransferase [Flavobacteriaceae bacterium]
MKHKLKIAIYSGAVPSTTFIERLIDGLAEKGAEIYLFGIQRKKIVVRKNIHLITYSNKLGKLFILLKYSLLLSLLKSSEKKKLDRIIFKKKQHNWLLKTKYYPVLFHQPDVFHLQWVKGIEDWIWVQEFGIKLIVSLRGAHINYSPITDSNLAEKYQNLFPKTDGFHSVSKAIIEEAIKYKANPAKIQVVYSGLDLDKIKFQLKTFNSSDTLKIITVGRDHWKKGYSYALNCMQILNTEGIKFNYTIVGVGTNEELLYLRSQFGLQNEINFIE